MTMLAEFLEYGFMQRALVVGVVTALICPAIGVFLVPRRLSLIADTLAHVALAGVALGLVLGVSPLVAALVVATAGAVGIERLRARGALAGDASLAVFLSGGLAVAVTLIGLAGGFNVDLFGLLFGSLLTVSPTDVGLILALGALVAGAIGACYPRLVAIAVNEDLARTSGVPVGALNLLVTVLTAFTTIVAMRMVGVLLVSAMIVLPTLVGFALARSFRAALGIAISVAVTSVVLGLAAAASFQLAAGASIVLVALVVFGLAQLVVLLGRRWRRWRWAATAGTLVVGALAGSDVAIAHPHVFAEYALRVVFDANGPQHVRFAYTFDELFSGMILDDFDRDRDGRFSPAESRLVHDKHFANVKTYGYFLSLAANGQPLPVEPRDFQPTIARRIVTYAFTVSLAGAWKDQGIIEIVVDDPTFYTAFAPVTRTPVEVQAPAHFYVDCRLIRDAKGATPDAVRCDFRRPRR